MKKIALINIGTQREDAICEPMQLGFLAAFLKQRGIPVKIIDQTAGDNIKLELAKYSPDYVGVTATTPLVNEAYRILNYCKNQSYTTIIGGTHASAIPDEAKKYADYVVVGEGENALYAIITEQIPYGIIKYPHFENIDDLPAPDRSSINMEFYVRHNIKEPVHSYYFIKRKMRMASMITSRGCPHACIYCHNSLNGKPPARYRSADHIFNEIVELKNKYHVDVIFFHDDDLFINKGRMLNICKKLEQSKLNLIWACNTRVTSVDKEVLDAAYQAGCRQLFYGIESGSQKVLDILNKKITVKQAEEAIRLTKQAGILVSAGFIIGAPGETRDDIKKTKEFFFSNAKCMDTLNLFVMTPFPGTALWDYCKAHKLIPESINWDDFRFDHGGFSINELFTKKQLKKMRFLMLMEVFFKFNIRFWVSYLKHPSFIMLKIAELFIAIIKPEKNKLHKH